MESGRGITEYQQRYTLYDESCSVSYHGTGNSCVPHAPA